MLNSIQNQELTRMVNKIATHTSDFVNYEVESISSDVKYNDGNFELQTDKIRLWGFVPKKCAILIDYTLKYNFNISKDYEHTITASIYTQDENERTIHTDISDKFDDVDGLIRYLNTTLK
jgi:hypothetical protein